MVRGMRVKEVRFSEIISATTTTTFTAPEASNGEILEVDLTYGTQGATGSIFLTTGENARELWRSNAPSGATTTTYYPRALTQLSTGSISVAGGARPTPFVINAPVVLNVIAALSGASPLEVVVRYR